jgi:SAM-dependent methyltransferase
MLAVLILAPVVLAQAPATGVAQIRREAAAVRPLVTSGLARGFLGATAELPAVAARTLYRDAEKKTVVTASAADRLDPEARKALTPMPVDETFYYTTRYGSPLAYARPLDLLGLDGADGLKVLDFGYGTVGHLRLLAMLGADATGVDVDPLLPALYGEPSDQGEVKSRGGRAGHVRLLSGRFPADPAIRTAVGEGYDLILSKNTLKRGYVHPSEPTDPRRLLNLGVDDAAFLKSAFAALKPGGRLLIYNLSPAPSPPGQPYKPWADGRCPFTRDDCEGAGFRVIEYDKDDSPAARALGKALEWDKRDGMNLEADLFGQYTILQRPGRP